MGINRGTVLDLINDVHRAGGFKDYNSYSYLFNQVDTMPESVEKPEPHWIPVTERLPEAKQKVLVQYADESMATKRCNDAGHLAWFYSNAVAWIPALEPYKEVTE